MSYVIIVSKHISQNYGVLTSFPYLQNTTMKVLKKKSFFSYNFFYYRSSCFKNSYNLSLGLNTIHGLQRFATCYNVGFSCYPVHKFKAYTNTLQIFASYFHVNKLRYTRFVTHDSALASACTAQIVYSKLIFTTLQSRVLVLLYLYTLIT